jgi:hypothetical protein
LNLRIATKSTNRQNARKNKVLTSKFKGVSWNKQLEKWEAEIVVNKAKLKLGYYPLEEGAAYAYNAAATVHFGEFACLNVLGA